MTKSIDPKEVWDLRNLGQTWVKIARKLKISEKGLKMWRVRHSFDDPRKFNEDDEVIVPLIKDYLRDHPHRGEVMAFGELRGVHKTNIQRKRMRSIIAAVDPIGLAMRRIALIPRVVYNGIAPGHIWHMDTHHKLGDFGFVTYGVVDGFSHELIALKCCPNNTAVVILNALVSSTGFISYGLPELIRADGGMENVAVGRLINALNGPNHFLVGRSVHNVRIERLWRVVHEQDTLFYAQLLATFVDQFPLVLDIHSVWILQYMLLDRINHDLGALLLRWNFHTMRSADGKMRSPTAQHKLHPDIRYRTFNSPEDMMLFNQHVTNVSNQLEQEYEGRPTARSECPFDLIQLQEFEQRVEKVAPGDKPCDIVLKLGQAIHEAQAILVLAPVI